MYLVTPMISRLKRKRERDGTREDPFSDNRGRKVKITRFHGIFFFIAGIQKFQFAFSRIIIVSLFNSIGQRRV